MFISRNQGDKVQMLKVERLKFGQKHISLSHLAFYFISFFFFLPEFTRADFLFIYFFLSWITSYLLKLRGIMLPFQWPGWQVLNTFLECSQVGLNWISLKLKANTGEINVQKTGIFAHTLKMYKNKLFSKAILPLSPPLLWLLL